MNSYRKRYRNILENKNCLTVVSRAHNTIESLENQAQDAFSVERTPPRFYMQRMGQLHILSLGRGRYNLKYYQKQDSLVFPSGRKVFKTVQEKQESFIIVPKRKRRNMIQIPTFFRIYPRQRKFNYIKAEHSDSVTFKKTRPEFEPQNENNFFIGRKKRPDYSIESNSDINIKADGKFFYNKPVLKKKGNLEIEYLVIKAPLKPVNETNIILEKSNIINCYKEILNIENKVDLHYNVHKRNSFSLKDINISDTRNIFLSRHYAKKYKELSIDDLPDLFIQECPAKRYVSVGMEKMSIISDYKPIYCLGIEFNEEIYIPNAYDMLLLQNYWNDLETKSFRICIRPRGYHPNKVVKMPKEVIKESKESSDDFSDEDEEKKEEEKNNEKKEARMSTKSAKRESKKEVAKKVEEPKKLKPFSLKQSIFGKK